MAEKRMFAKSIISSDVFLEMSLGAKSLYLVMGTIGADDDGFIGNPKAIMRLCGASEKDLKELLDKRYLLAFDTGVMVIKHWRINNYLRKDRYMSTTYQEEYNLLDFDEKGAYVEKTKAKKIKKDLWKEKDEKIKTKLKKYKRGTEAQLPDYDKLESQIKVSQEEINQALARRKGVNK